MMIFANLVRIETDFYFEFLFRFGNTLGLRDFEDALFLNFRVIKLPSDFVFIDVLNHDTHEFGVASIRFRDNFPLEIDN